MSLEKMAPEAFTHSELAEAMTWRERQPEYIQKMTGSPSALMSFYKQVQRSKDLKAPASPNAEEATADFQADLKSMAESLNRTTEAQKDKQLSLSESPLSNDFSTTEPPDSTPSTSQEVAPPATNTSVKMTFSHPLDPESQKMLTGTREQLNLSNDQEALRALIKLGFEKLKSL